MLLSFNAPFTIDGFRRGRRFRSLAALLVSTSCGSFAILAIPRRRAACVAYRFVTVTCSGCRSSRPHWFTTRSRSSCGARSPAYLCPCKHHIHALSTCNRSWHFIRISDYCRFQAVRSAREPDLSCVFWLHLVGTEVSCPRAGVVCCRVFCWIMSRLYPKNFLKIYMLRNVRIAS